MKKEVFILANANMNDVSEVTHLVSALGELDKKINKITSSMNKREKGGNREKHFFSK